MGYCSSTKPNENIDNRVKPKNIISFKQNLDIIAPIQLQSQQIFTEENHLFKVDLNTNETFIHKIKEALLKINSLDFDYLTEIKNIEYKNFLIS